MKARRKDTNDEWREIDRIQLSGTDILYKPQYLEFDTLSTELKTYQQVDEEKHWQDIRERAAIAALQGLLSHPDHLAAIGRTSDKERLSGTVVAASAAVEFADGLIKLLKNEAD